jgi:hypothetical protein
MHISPRGAVVGAIVGAAARAAVVWLHLGPDVPRAFFVPSAAIGFLVGAIAGGLGRPVRGLIAGFVLSAIVFELLLMPCVSLLGTFGGAAAKQEFLWDSVRYALEMGAAGALAGLAGGLAARGKTHKTLE